MLVSAKASAMYHEMKVVEVFAGSAAAPTASYVQLQMYSAGQSFVGGHVLHVYDATGAEIMASKVTFAGNVANGANQANILVGTSSVQAAFGVPPDFVLPANLPKNGGAVCFENLDCFTWGTYAPAQAPDISVVPFPALDANKAARRSIAKGDPTILDLADDGNNIVDDFTAVDPAPKNNIGPLPDAGTTPEAGLADASTPPKDSGVGTQPSPNNPVVTPDAGSSGTSSSSSADSGGCSVVHEGSEGSASLLGLAVAASIFALSRRRRSPSKQE
jgi:MYXO-CTERM domain-containing protein